MKPCATITLLLLNLLVSIDGIRKHRSIQCRGADGRCRQMPMKLVGKVTEVCQAKGCWMNVVADNGQGEPIFVQFKDYGFFMPKDCAGKKVTMDGIVYRETTPVDELRHYAQDKGASAEEIAAITMPKEELKFMAKGVILHEK